jgi:phosphatidylserine/phosphatidylglycerophosphate/cardiolipin synthase-like enzyme
MYPGWEALADRSPVPVAASARVTVAVAPDNAYAVLAGLLNRAQHEILVGAYSFDSVWLTGVLTERIHAGVQVTMLLEGGPAGGLSEATLWNCARVAAAGGQVFFAHHDPSAGIYGRYRNHHAKYLVVDGRWLAVGSENYGNHAMPVDDKSNGTAGDRGVFLVVDQRQVAEPLRALFDRDCDPARHLDVVAYGEIPRYVVPPTYTAIYSTGGGGYEYMAPFSATLPGWAAGRIQVDALPQTSMSTEHGLLGWVLRAGPGDRVDVEQMNEALHWGAADSSADVDPNPRLEAYVQAARNGAQVRILLDSGLDDEGRNRDTAFYLIALAEAEGLDLEVRLGNPTGRGIHNKMVLVDRGPGEQCVHAGSLNGSEASNKVNREIGVQLCSPGVHAYLTQVFEYDWAHSGGAYELWLPLVYHEAVRESEHVVISEVVFRLTGTEQGEWIELYNPTAQVVDLSGWRLGDAVHREDYERCYAFPERTTIAPFGTLVVARQAVAYRSLGYETQAAADLEWHRSDDTPNMIRTAWGEDEFLLGNGGDEVLLLDPQNQAVDVVVYGSGAYDGVAPFVDLDAVYNGNSLERWPANWDSDDCVRDFRVRYVPAPGAVNHR